ncbi:flagellar hook-basal body protein [Desulfobulbus propionicus DSM 2032]|jgi:flagellar hook protein FlgE|uniref:Flagellar hook protein FlgE n=1 Tax=Desulfobulbus propionicus (strain ATCC 33891 / DSM 2032 / VKM B-1956 / 1pr3) TaxID=577650 RepID=A0A7U4DPH5_DESPD|nr:flagellar hook protein FlgE [Desulfobulbus propionicus]ADW17997.1 flagellar hook-basal body protein [Desulfobulbus propionicus DSM 2032]
MGLSSALFTAISGLQGSSQAMTVTGNNIANSSTVGFKTSSTVFSDLLSANIASSSGNSQVGRGSQVQTVQTSFSQGGFESTESATDIAIEGSGFFIVGDPLSDTSLYTRNGNFSFDDDGYLVTADGYRVQGSTYNANGVLASGNLSDIQVDLVSQIKAKRTENVTLQTNLDSNSEVLNAGVFDSTAPEDTSNYATTTTVYDSLGTAHLLTCYFTKVNDQTWNWNLTVDGADLTGGTSGVLEIIGSGTLVFDQDGNLSTGSTGTTTSGILTWANGADQTQQLAYVFDTTQFDSDSTVFSQDQDGYASGEVTDVDIAADGTVSAVYSNGETIPVAMIALATFINSDGLDAVGSSLYRETGESGTPTIGYPGASQGTLITQALELSNVDLATEFVDLITIQNAYSANSKVITTTNEMLDELVNLIR